MRRVFVHIALALTGLAQAGQPGYPFDDAEEHEELLLSFESDEIESLVKALEKHSKTLGPTKVQRNENGIEVTLPSRLGSQLWIVRTGEASQGDSALRLTNRASVRKSQKGSRRVWDPLDKSGHPERDYFALPPHPEWYPWSTRAYLDDAPEAPVDRYRSLTRIGYRGVGLSISGLLGRVFAADWSAYDRLRFDVFCSAGSRRVRVALEDADIEPPVHREVTVEAGRWYTVELDLRRGVSSRGLDSQHITGLYVMADGEVLIDSVRLCLSDTACKFPILRDDSPQTLPAYYRASAGPQPETFPSIEPDRSPIPLEPPTVITSLDDGFSLWSSKPKNQALIEEVPMYFKNKGKWKDYLGVTPCGWASAFDNSHLLVGFTAFNKRNVFVLQSMDGGKTWRGLDGKDQPTPISVPNPDHGSGHGDVVGRRGDAMILANLGCCGHGARPSLRLFAQKLTFTESGWQLRPTPALIDCEPRHCNANQSIIRLPNGRLWAAYCLVGREGRLCVHARYSDDDGRVWKSWRVGKSGLIPGSHYSSTKNHYQAYIHLEPCLVPWKKGIACLWREQKAAEGRLLWSRFDGSQWSAPEDIPAAKWEKGQPGPRWPQPYAVSLHGKEVFLVCANIPGVLHFCDGHWQQEAGQIPPGGKISAAGEDTVVVFAAVNEGEQTALRSWERSPDGSWLPPVELNREDQPLSMDRQRIGLVVQAYAPANFVPVAWTCQKQRWIKFLRVPIEAYQPAK